MSIEGITRTALERATASVEGARHIGAQLTGYTSQHVQGLLAEMAARVLPSGGTSGQVLSKNSSTSYDVGWSAGGGSTQPFPDSTALVKNNTDNTKLLRVDASAVATGTTRVLTMPDADVNLTADQATGTASLRTLGTGAQQAVAGNDSRFDSLLRVSATEVPITTATTLTSTAFGKSHVISGASNYTIGLPAVSGNANKVIVLRVDRSAAGFFTIDPNGAETWDGKTTKVLLAPEKVTLLCDGTQWLTYERTGSERVAFVTASQSTAAPATIAASTYTTLTYNSKTDPWNVFTTSTGVYVPPKDGYFMFGAMCSFDSSVDQKQIRIALFQNSTTPAKVRDLALAHTSGTTTVGVLGWTRELVTAGSTYFMRCWHNFTTTPSIVADPAFNWFEAWFDGYEK